MVSSLLNLGTAFLACASGVVARGFTLAETYDASNFFSHFRFNTTGTLTDRPDDNWALVEYLDENAARTEGLVNTNNSEVYLGVDYTTILDDTKAHVRRKSLRLVSKRTYRHGLIIARFTHMPKPVCGGWPAFWTLGAGPVPKDSGAGKWPDSGEIDLYEGWNTAEFNLPTLHTGAGGVTNRSCTLDGADQTAKVLHDNCDNRKGSCQAREQSGGILGSETGGTQALEWTSEYIKIYTWPSNEEPADIKNNKEKPDTATWGMPSVHLKTAFCDIDQAFQEQRIMFSLAFCGNPVSDDQFWKEKRGPGGQTCHEATGMTCTAYVARNPGDFEDFYFRIKNIQYFSETDTEPSRISTSLRTSSTHRPKREAHLIFSPSSSSQTSSSIPSKSRTQMIFGSMKSSETLSSVQTGTRLHSTSNSSISSETSSSTHSDIRKPRTSDSAISSKTLSSIRTRTGLHLISSSSSKSSETLLPIRFRNGPHLISDPATTSSKTLSSIRTRTGLHLTSSSSSKSSETSSLMHSKIGKHRISDPTTSLETLSSIPTRIRLHLTSSSLMSSETSLPIRFRNETHLISDPATSSGIESFVQSETGRTQLPTRSFGKLSSPSSSSNASPIVEHSLAGLKQPVDESGLLLADEGSLLSAGESSDIATTTASEERMALTVYKTIVASRSCPPWIDSCHTGQATTIYEPWYTTVCPVKAIATQAIETNRAPGSWALIVTIRVTMTFRITSCPPRVLDCPIGSIGKIVVFKKCSGGKCKNSGAPARPELISPESQVPDNALAGSAPENEPELNGPHKQDSGNAPAGNAPGAGVVMSATKVVETLIKNSCPPTELNCRAGSIETAVVTEACKDGECSLEPNSSREKGPVIHPDSKSPKGKASGPSRHDPSLNSPSSKDVDRKGADSKYEDPGRKSTESQGSNGNLSNSQGPSSSSPSGEGRGKCAESKDSEVESPDIGRSGPESTAAEGNGLSSNVPKSNGPSGDGASSTFQGSTASNRKITESKDYKAKNLGSKVPESKDFDGKAPNAHSRSNSSSKVFDNKNGMGKGPSNGAPASRARLVGTGCVGASCATKGDSSREIKTVISAASQIGVSLLVVSGVASILLL